MSRKIKNIVMIILVGLSLFSSYLTINWIKNNNESSNIAENGNGNTPPELPGENDNMQDPPEKMDDEGSNEILEKPDGENQDETNTPPEKPDEKNQDETNMPNKFEKQQGNNSSNISYIRYMVFGIENLILGSLIIYLIMSKFNKKTFKETLSNKDKITIMLLSIVIITLGLTLFDMYVVKNFKENNIELPNDMNNSTDSISYSSANEINEDTIISSGDYTSSNEDENAILVNGYINATLSNINVNKTGDSDGGDNTSFYGINSAIIAKDGANLTLKNITVTTNATGANGVFSYGGSATTNNSSSDGTTVTISDSTITTKKDNSGGIMTTGGGITKATNLTVTTAGISSAAIRTDRGGGEVTVNKGTYTTTGAGSPAIYSTANIYVSNAKLISKTAEGIVIEGKNSVTINSCELTDSNAKLNGQSTTYKNIFLYQSMSGDAADGKSEFTATDSTITTNNGDTLYVTNTTATINLENNTIINNDTDGNFLRIQKDSWGNTGSNGGDVELIMTNQTINGNIVVDSISTLDMSLKSSSYYEGTINNDNTAESISLSLDKTSKIKLTGDSYITSLSNKDSSNSNIDFNGYKLYVNGKAIN
jgi:hypothetical protein